MCRGPQLPPLLFHRLVGTHTLTLRGYQHGATLCTRRAVPFIIVVMV